MQAHLIVYIFYPESLWRDALWQAIRPALIFGVLASLVSILLLVVVAGRLTRRIQQMEQRTGQIAALMYDLADRVGDIFAEQFRNAGYDPKAAPIYAHALVGMIAFVGQWWTETRKPPPAELVASHIAALAWMGLRHLPRRPALLPTSSKQRR